jgi:error-prone DNA polymerase
MAARRRLPDLFLAARHLHTGEDERRLDDLARLAKACATPLIAVNDVHYHDPLRRPLQDILTCIRLGCTIDQAGRRLFANAERHLKGGAEMARLFHRHPEALARTLEIKDACRFSLEELRYEYPAEEGSNGPSAQEELARLAWEGARWRYPPERYPEGPPAKVKALLEHELSLIARLDYAPYFLTVHDIVRFARERGILCQGRGSAANSAVCYCLGITAVDPERIDLLFERFVSAERDEPPDIDVDFEHERREEVIQYIYGKYGRERAGLAATVIHYRPKSALREVAKAMGLSRDTQDALARHVWGWEEDEIAPRFVLEAGLNPREPRLARTLALARELVGFPRHLSQHVGGFVITRGSLSELVPIENAAMPERTVIQWDKDDLDALGILKIDVLALGMLTCLAKGFALIAQAQRRRFDLASVPPEDPAVYEMLGQGDSLGVFQIESRAQMAMLPRLKPKTFYDLVIEVALVRPGPIQGDMVHPYLRRRDGLEAVEYPSIELQAVLGKTLGVPLFQEQAMRIAIVAAGFTPAEADGLRRAMATFRRSGTIGKFREKFIQGMLARSYAPGFAERCFRQIEGFADYGFPESHAASFALLAYVSAWMKRHYPAAFACALLNSQPMGFYAPAQVVRDAQNHGVEVRAVDVNYSDWDCTLEGAATHPALRLGLRQVKGLKETPARRIIAERGSGYATLADLARRAGMSQAILEILGQADAFASMGLSRRPGLWAAKGIEAPAPLFVAAPAEGSNLPACAPDMDLMLPPRALPPMALGEEVIADYEWLSLSLKAHPLSLLRADFAAKGWLTAARLKELGPGEKIRIAGLVIVRQRPGTAKGVVFVTIEDETGIANVIVWPKLFNRYRRVLLGAKLLGVRGRLQRQGSVIHVIAEQCEDRTGDLHRLLPPALIGPLAVRAFVPTAGAGLGSRAGEAPIPPSRDFR